MKQQKGFTLIELIIVIVILGILAVTAAPRFFDFSKDARISTVEGAKAAVQGASQIIYGKAAIAGQLGAMGTHNGKTVVDGGIETVYGYPAGKKVAIQAAASLSSDDWVFDDSTTPGTVYIMPIGKTYTATVTEQCHVSYTAAASASAAPAIATSTQGC